MFFTNWFCFRKSAAAKMPLKKAVFGVQCFWGAESSFAKLDGVVRTRVGYAGGNTPNPTYESVSDHTEVVEAEYDDNLLSYDSLLRHFWDAHDPTIHRKKQVRISLAPPFFYYIFVHVSNVAPFLVSICHSLHG